MMTFVDDQVAIVGKDAVADRHVREQERMIHDDQVSPERFGLSREIGAAVIPEKWAGFRPAAFGFGAELPPDIAFAGPDQRNSAAVAGSALAQPDEDFRQDAEFIRSIGSARLQP